MTYYIPSTGPINCKIIYFRFNYKEPQQATVQIVPYLENHKATSKVRKNRNSINKRQECCNARMETDAAPLPVHGKLFRK
jgi:hypothetical protein